MAVDAVTPGGELVRASWVATGALVVSDGAAAFGPKPLLIPGAVVAVALFLGGCAVFVVAYVTAARRSRTHALDLAGLFFLAGSAPARVRRDLLASTITQSVVALVCASLRPAAAAGILAPVSALSLGALWSARHGEFRRR